MVSIVTGNGLGLIGSSGNVLGTNGQLGTAITGGQGSDKAYLNAKTGNLVIQHQDELLVGRGIDIGVVRTYNSQGQLDFDNNDNWQLSLYRQISSVTGTVNTAGSTVTRTAADGTQLIYTYDSVVGNSTYGKYVNKDGSGSYDTLTYTSSNNQWVWTDGDSRVSETYTVDPSNAAQWRISSFTDLDGNTQTYSYDTTTGSATYGLITQVLDANGEKTQLIYNASKQLTQINVINSSSVTTTRVRYTYDTNTPARLSTVVTDLTPADGSITDNNTYTTTYTYDGTSKRVASITNGDSSKVSFGYDTSATPRVNSITDGNGNKTTITYNTGNTVITDASAQATTLTYSVLTDGSNGQLTRLQGPTGSGQDIQYTYNANGDVTSMTDARGNITSYSYDLNGNQIAQQDSAGNVIERTYGMNNQLLTETTYTVADPDGYNTGVTASSPQTTRYIYSADGKNHLRFILSPEGRVTEYQYNAAGQQTSAIHYPQNTFDVTSLPSWTQDFSVDTSGLTPTTLPSGFARTNNTLVATATNQTTRVISTLNGVDKPLGTLYRGEVTTPPDSMGNYLLKFGISDAAGHSYYVLFSSGGLYPYYSDGSWPGNYGSSFGWAKVSTTYVVEFATQSDGTVILNMYEKGKLRSSGFTERHQVNIGASHFYLETNSDGSSVGPLGHQQSIVIDNLSTQKQPQEADMLAWLTAAIKSKSTRTDYSYDARGQLTTQTVYTSVDSTAGNEGKGVTTGAQTTQYVYDQGGNLVQKINPRGVASTGTNTATMDYTKDDMSSYSYDGMNRLILSKVYDGTGLEANATSTTTVYNSALKQTKVTLANGLSSTQTYDAAGQLLSIVKSDSTGALGTTSYTYDTLGNLRQVKDPLGLSTYYLYDSLNRQVGVIDPTGALTETVYNNNNQIIRTIRYNTLVASANLTDANALKLTLGTATASTINVRPTVDATNDRTSYRLYDKAGRLAKEIDALGAVTEYQYDGVSRLVKTTQYANPLSATQRSALAALTTELLPTNPNTIPTVDTTVGAVTNTANDRITRNLYSPDNLLIGTLDGEGYLTEYSYDAASRLSSVTRYGTQSPSAQWATGTLANLRPAANSSLDQTTQNIYDAANQRVGIVDAEGYLTENQYDLAGNVTTQIRYATKISYVAGNTLAQSRPADAGTNPENQATVNVYDTNNRLIQSTSNPNGLVTNYTYDKVGNLNDITKTYAGAAVTDQRRTSRRYNSLGQLTAELSGEGINALNALGSTPTQAQIDTIWNSYGTRYSYDLDGNLMSKISPDGSTASGNKTLYYYNNRGQLLYSINALGEVTEQRYNTFGQGLATRFYATRIASTTLSTLTGGLASTLGTTVSSLASAGYSESQVAYDQDGRIISSTSGVSNTNSVGDTNTRSYNVFGELIGTTTKIDASNSLLTNYVYDHRGLQSKTIEDSAGINRITQAVYDAFGRITQTTDGLNNTIKHSYDRLGREVTTTDALNINTVTSYDAFSRKLTRTDGRNNTTTYSYNSAARTMTMKTAEGISVTTKTNAYGDTVTVTDGRANSTTYTYNADGQLKTTTTADGNTITNNYDAAGHLSKTTDANGTVTLYSYDAANRLLTRTIDPTSVNPTGLNISTQYRYDALGRNTWTKDGNGVWTRTDYDAKGQVTSIVVDPSSIPDASGNPANLVANATGLNLTTSYTYDARGKKLTVVEGAGTTSAKTTQYLYDKLGRLSQSIVDPHVTAGDSKLAITTSYVYDQDDNVLLKTDANGNNTVYSYDKNNRLIYTVKAATSDGQAIISKRDYDANGNVLTETRYATLMAATSFSSLVTNAKTGAVGTITPTLSSSDAITAYVYDKDNRRTYSIDAQNYVSQTIYDANGNVTQTTRYATALASRPAAGVAPAPTSSVNDQTTQTVYDAMNRAIFSVDAQNYVTQYDYDSNGNLMDSARYANAMAGTLTQNVSPNILYASTGATGNYVLADDTRDQWVSYGYDSLNRRILLQHYQYNAATTSLDNIDTNYIYDNVGHQIRIEEVASDGTILRTTKQEFDTAGRKTAVIDALGNRTSTTYDAVGNITSITDAAGNTGYFYNDALGRVTLQVNPEGAVTETQYDALGNTTSIIRYANKVVGSLSTATRPSIVSTVPNPVTGPYLISNASLDQKQTVIYDKLNHQSAIQTWWGTGANDYYTESFTYDAFGNVLSAVARNGGRTDYTYDTLNRKLTESLPATSRNSSNALTRIQNNYAYDFAGNLTTKTEAVGLPEQRITSYTYDKLNHQLTESVNTYRNTSQPSVVSTKSKTYDARGNLNSETDANNNKTSYYYDALDRRIGTVTADGVYTRLNYDAVGNKTSQTTYATKLNVASLSLTTIPTLVQDAANDRTTYYTYDKLGRQTGTEIKNITTGTYNTTAQQYQITDPTSATSSIKTQTFYDALGNVIKQIDANNNITRNYYNKAGQLTAKVDAAGYLMLWIRDSYGNISQETRYANKTQLMGTATLDTGVPQILTTAPAAGSNAVYVLSDGVNDRTTVMSYDKLNRVLTESAQNVAQGTVNTSNGALTQTTLPTLTSYQYDGLNNITQKTDATGAITNWTYDKLGRQTAQLNPSFTDYMGYLVRPETDKEYDGLGNVKREIKRGTDNTTSTTTNSGQTETDDHITTYTYSTGGRLLSQTDATGAVTQYEYDAQGNVTKKTLLNRLNADGVATNDITTYSYDAQNRQISSQDQGTGLMNEVQYNSFGQITGKRSYVGTTPTTWSEFAQYDQAGRVWKSNSGDGVIKVTVYDGNGNATLSITSTSDMRNLTLSQVLAQQQTQAAAQLAYNSLTPAQKATNPAPPAQQVQYTISQYDTRNQLINTIQPSMNGSQGSASIVQVNGAGSVVVPTNAAGSTNSVLSNGGTNPVTGGSVGVGGSNIAWSMTLSSTGANAPAFNMYPSDFANVNISLPINELGSGNFIVQVSLTIKSAANPSYSNFYSTSYPSQTTTVSGSKTNLALQFAMGTRNSSYSPLVQGISVSIVKVVDTTLGNVQLVNGQWTGNLLTFGSYTAFGWAGGVTSSSQTIVTPKKLYFTGQPPNTSSLFIGYRPVGSTGAYTLVGVPQMINTAGAAMPGMYAFDYTSIPAGNYDIQYIAHDSAGLIINQQVGNLNTTGTPTVSQSNMPMGNAGRAFFMANSSYGALSGDLQLANQATHAKTASLKYREKGSGAAWSSAVALNSQLPGWFGLSTAGRFAANKTYEVQFDIKDANGVSITQSQADLTVDAAGNKTMGQINLLAKLRFTQPISTQYVDLRYRTAGSGANYSAPIRLTPTSAGSGLYDWDATALGNMNVDIDLQAYDSNGVLLNRNQVIGTLNSNGTLSNVTSNNIAVPQTLRILPPQTGVNSIQLSYRLKGSANTVAYTPLAASAYNNNGTGEFRASLPLAPSALAAGEYEYLYTTYASTDGTGASLGSNTGYFTVAPATNNATRLDWVISTAANSNQISRSQSYNAFGEILSETDGNGNTTSYTYNTLGKMLSKLDPQVSITLSNGSKQTTAPITNYTYDAMGRLVAVQDANGNLNTQTWVTGAPPASNDQTSYERHADGGQVSNGYDIFGNKRVSYDELTPDANRRFVATASLVAADRQHRTDYTYDAADRLIRIDRPERTDGSNAGQRAYDLYAYDAAGQRISHTNTLGIVDKTYYDSLGRVTKTTLGISASSLTQGLSTSYNYTYNNAIVGLGSQTTSGWTKTTINADGRTLIDQIDQYNRVVWHQDLGGHQFTYNYNLAGWLMSQTGTTGQNIAYTHYNNGFIQSIWDKAAGMYTYYEYDKDGNKTFEGYISLKNPLDVTLGAKDYYQYATMTYDGMNRMTSMTDPKATITYDYDAVGNRRHVNSYYHDGVNGAKQTQDYWYTYDSMNRFTVTMGTLSNGVITQGTTGGAGVAISYNAAGQRTQVTNAKDGTVERYAYTNDGYLTTVTVGGSTISTRTNDLLGRVTTVTQGGATRTTTYDSANRVNQETGTDGTTDYYYYNETSDNAGQAIKTGNGALAKTTNTNGGTTVNTYYAYQYWDEDKQMAITNQAYNPVLKGNNAYWKPGYSEMNYDVNGHLVSANDAGTDGVRGTGDDRNFTYVNDAQGLILSRSEIAGNSVNRVQRYYYVDGKRVGDVGNDGPNQTDYVTALANQKVDKKAYANWKPVASADFDQNYQAVSPTYPGATPSNYVVKNGDTLQSIALAVWGDSSMWYLIADANGLTSTQGLTTGQNLTIPNKITNIHNNSGTYRPYNAGEAIGDTSPTLPTAPPVPQPKKHGCGGFLSIIVAVVAVVATVYTAGALAPASAALAAGGGTVAAGTFATGLAVLGGTAGLSVGAGFAIGFAAGAVGSIAGQLAGNVLGVQSGFSWGAVAAGAIGAGIGASSTVGGLLNKVPGGAFGQALAGNLINQGVGIITGAQKGFSWASVAASAIAAPITSKINESIKGNASFGDTSNAGYALRGAVAGVATSAVNELTRVAIVGGKLNWSSVAIGGVQGGIYGVGEGLRANANALNQAIYADNFDADRKARAQMLGLGGNNAESDTPSVLRLSDDEVISNAMARQAAEKGFSGLNVSWTDSPAQQNAKNGGLNVAYSTAQAEGVVYGKEQYMNGMPRTAGAGDVKGNIDATNTINGVNKIITKAPIMSRVESLVDNSSLARTLGLGAYESESQTKKTFITDDRNVKSGRYDNSAWSGKSMMNQVKTSSQVAYKNATTYNKDNFADKKPLELDFKYELFNSGGRPADEFFGQRSFTDGSGNIVASVGKKGIEMGFDINREWVSEYMNTEGVIAGMPVKINASSAAELKADVKFGAKITKNGLKADAYAQAGGEVLAFKLPTTITFGQYPIGDYVFSPQLTLTFNAGGVSAYAGAGYQSYKTKLGGEWLLGLGVTPVILGATAKATVGVQPK